MRRRRKRNRKNARVSSEKSKFAEERVLTVRFHKCICNLRLAVVSLRIFHYRNSKQKAVLSLLPEPLKALSFPLEERNNKVRKDEKKKEKKEKEKKEKEGYLFLILLVLLPSFFLSFVFIIDRDAFNQFENRYGFLEVVPSKIPNVQNSISSTSQQFPTRW